ncbi:hypothetical protein [Aureimonas phyllosphaerae]|uniref:Uncharacterized protein n=1 Tax=Aureimonas phyllosphaerae TaxID=1166078 RepID=A0A7W6BQE0_9HYPH|nr:hypothetical protein [Aureimonas phyllosphaerae]MBB3936156.1 hypothetical protein [Aureimonas phyllosphaerae]MBB3960119.1 hypothetical protein [Aureimonas phyllosphaerae]
MRSDAEIDSAEEDRSVSVELKKGIDRQSSIANAYGFTRHLATGIDAMSDFCLGKGRVAAARP